MGEKYFPVFLNISGKKALVVGAGTIAGRRIKGLLSFGAEVKVIAPEISEEIEKLTEQYHTVKIIKRGFLPGDTDGADFVLSATDAADTETAVYEECRAKGLPVNLASDQTRCDFYFPALIEEDDLVIGVCSGGKDHKKVRRVSAKIRQVLQGQHGETCDVTTDL